MSERRVHHADGAEFRQAMRALTSGVTIVACGDCIRPSGCTVTAFSSLSLTPPTLIVCLAKTSSTLAHLRESGAFSVNVLAPRHEALAQRFSGRGGVHGVRRFEGAEWRTLATGAPVLADAIAAFDCLVEEVIERHSHAVVVGAVVSLADAADGPTLLYGRGQFSVSPR